MFIITVAGHEKDGSIFVVDEDGEQVLYIFQEEDDATRYTKLEELTTLRACVRNRRRNNDQDL